MKRLQTRDLDFARAARKLRKKPENTNNRKYIYILIPILLLALGVGGWDLLVMQGASYTNQMVEADNATLALLQEEDYSLSAKASALLTQLQSEQQTAAAVREALDSYPEANQALFDQIAADAGSNITLDSYTFTSEDGMLTISGKANGITETAAFVSRLRARGNLFYALDYTGYAIESEKKDGQPADAASGYRFTVTAILRGKGAAANAQ